jgi:hypothetical protein
MNINEQSYTSVRFGSSKPGIYVATASFISSHHPVMFFDLIDECLFSELLYIIRFTSKHHRDRNDNFIFARRKIVPCTLM